MNSNNIENIYTNYDDILESFGEDVIMGRFAQILEEMNMFLRELDMQDKAQVQEMALMHALLDYFSDIKQLKSFQDMQHVNEMKIKAYETYWLLQRKPIQLVTQLEDDQMLYINEKFLLSRLASFMLGEDMKKPMVLEQAGALKKLLDTLYYFMKFREINAQTLELMLLAYKAGRLFSE